MRIGYDHTAFVRQRTGGIARYYCEIASRIAGRQRVKAFLGLHLAECADVVRGSADAVGLRRPDLPKTHRLAMAVSDAALPLVSARWSVDVYHATGQRFKSFGGASRRVVTLFDCIPERIPAEFDDADATRRRKRRAAREADAVICISETTGRDAMELLDVPGTKIHVTRLAPGVDAVPGEEDPVGRPYLLYVGRRHGYKNARVLFEVLARADLPGDPVLVCFGGERPGPRERRRIARRGLVDRVEYREGDDRALATLYSHARALVVTAAYEGFGLPVLEAMKFGCPVVCSDGGALPEVAGDAALHFEAGDAEELRTRLERVLTDGELRRGLRDRGLTRAGEFSWSRCVEETLACYRSVL